MIPNSGLDCSYVVLNFLARFEPRSIKIVLTKKKRGSYSYILFLSFSTMKNTWNVVQGISKFLKFSRGSMLPGPPYKFVS